MGSKPTMIKSQYPLPALACFNSHSGMYFCDTGIIYDAFRVTVNRDTWLVFERDKTDKSRFVATGFTQVFSETVPILNDTIYSLIEKPANGKSRIWSD